MVSAQKRKHADVDTTQEQRDDKDKKGNSFENHCTHERMGEMLKNGFCVLQSLQLVGRYAGGVNGGDWRGGCGLW